MSRDRTELKINIIKDGPYRVSGGAPLSTQAIAVNEARESVDWIPVSEEVAQTPYFLCRCGHSANKPFCDGSHAAAGFNGAETASRTPYSDQAEQLRGPALTLFDDKALCAGARFCDRAGTVWATIAEVSTADERAAFIDQVSQCPSGRLVAHDNTTGSSVERDIAPSIVLVEDPSEGVRGPIWVRGGISVIGSDGAAYEPRNRITLCRCGASANKPFCDGSHFQTTPLTEGA